MSDDVGGERGEREKLRDAASVWVPLLVAVVVIVIITPGTRLVPGWVALTLLLVASAGFVALVVGALVEQRRELRAYFADADDDHVQPAIEALVRNDALVDFEQAIRQALDRLPDDLRAYMSNVEIAVEDEPPPGEPLLGLYQGLPQSERRRYYRWLWPVKITIFRGPLERMCGDDHVRLEAEIERTVLHEIAHHFGISDERLLDLGAY